MPISIITPALPPRDPTLEWDSLGPGLYPGEIGVALSTGEKVAVSVEPTWLENGAGVSLNGNARWIDATGQTLLDPDKKHVEANLIVTATMTDVAKFTLDAMARDVAFMLLGEGMRLMRAADIKAAVPERPVFDVSVNTLEGVSIKRAADAIKAMKGFKLSLA